MIEEAAVDWCLKLVGCFALGAAGLSLVEAGWRMWRGNP